MWRKNVRLISLGLPLMVAGLIAGCSGGFVPNSLCGSRTVTKAPEAGYLEMSVSIDMDIQPTDGALAKVLFGGLLCEDLFGEFEIPSILYEIGDNGEVVSMITLFEMDGQKFYSRSPFPGNQSFKLEDGCFELGGWDGGGQLAFHSALIGYGPCGSGLPAVTQQGLTTWDPVGDYTCLTGAVAVCQDCWNTDDAWRSETTVDGTYRASGAVSDVYAGGWASSCDAQEQLVDIQTGDQVQFTYTLRMTYTQSPSPEELGYQEFQMPTFPTFP